MDSGSVDSYDPLDIFKPPAEVSNEWLVSEEDAAAAVAKTNQAVRMDDFSGVTMSGIFGGLDIDVADIADDPFFIAPGTYWAVCSDAKISEKEGKKSFVIIWTITEPDSEYNSSTVTEYFGMAEGVWKELDAKQQKAWKFLKKRLREAFDLSEEDMKTVNPEDLVGMGAFITIKNNPGKEEGQSFANVNLALCQRIYEEKNGEQGAGDNSTSQFGMV